MILQTFSFEYLRESIYPIVVIGMCCSSVLESMDESFFNDKLSLKFRIVKIAMVEIMSWFKTQRNLIVMLEWQSKR